MHKMGMTKDSYELFIETASYLHNGDTNTLGRCLPVEAAVPSLLAQPLDPPLRIASVLKSTILSYGRGRYGHVYIGLPEYKSEDDLSRGQLVSPGRQPCIAVWAYSDVSKNHRPDTLVARSPESLPGPEALRELGRNSYDNRHYRSIDAIVGSPDCTLLVLKSLCGSDTPSDWLAKAAASNLSIGVATRFYGQDVYVDLLGRSINSIAHIYAFAPVDCFLYWAGLLQAPDVGGDKGMLNAWVTGPLGPRLTWIYRLMQSRAGGPCAELKLIPLLRDADPALAFLFALDVSYGPLLEYTVRFLRQGRCAFGATYGQASMPLRNLFCFEVTEEGQLSYRKSALMTVFGLLDIEDLQEGLNESLQYQATRYGSWRSSEYYNEAPYLVFDWDLVKYALAENPGLIISVPPTNENMLLVYLELSEPGPLAGRINLRGLARNAKWLWQLYGVYGGINHSSHRDDRNKIADWHGIDRASFMSVFDNGRGSPQVWSAILKLTGAPPEGRK